MKTHIKNYAILSAIFGMIAWQSGAYALVVYDVDDWYATGTNAASISAGGTNSPTLNYTNTETLNNYASTALWSYFADNASPATLLDGYTLTFSAGIAINFTTAASRTIPIRFGLFDSSAPRATTDGAGGNYNYTSSRIGSGSTFGLGNNTNARNGWSGIIANDGVDSGNSNIFQRDVNNTTTTWSSTGGGVNGPVALNSGIINQTFQDNIPISLTLNLKRVGLNLEFFGSWGANSFSGIYSNYFAGDYPATFDTFGFFMSGQTGSPALTSLSISNATVSLVPEPTAGVLMLGVAGVTLLLRYRNRNREV